MIYDKIHEHDHDNNIREFVIIDATRYICLGRRAHRQFLTKNSKVIISVH